MFMLKREHGTHGVPFTPLFYAWFLGDFSLKVPLVLGRQCRLPCYASQHLTLCLVFVLLPHAWFCFWLAYRQMEYSKETAWLKILTEVGFFHVYGECLLLHICHMNLFTNWCPYMLDNSCKSAAEIRWNKEFNCKIPHTLSIKNVVKFLTLFD